MSEEYVRKDVFDEVIKRLEERDNKTEDTAAISVMDLHSRIDDLKDRIEDMKHSHNIAITRWGIVITVCIFVFQLVISLLLRK